MIWPAILFRIRGRFRRWRRTTRQDRIARGRATLADFPVWPFNPEA